MEEVDKSRENLARRRVARRGLMLRKSRRRDEHAIDYGKYWVTNPYINCVVYGGQNGADLAGIEAWLDEDDK